MGLDETGQGRPSKLRKLSSLLLYCLPNGKFDKYYTSYYLEVISIFSNVVIGPPGVIATRQPTQWSQKQEPESLREILKALYMG